LSGRGWGVAVDRVISDFVQGTVEWMVEQAEALGDWVIVEGQGSLDVDFANTFLLTNGFDLISNFVRQADMMPDRFDENERRRGI